MMDRRILRAACATLATATFTTSAFAANSQWVKVGQSGRLIYTMDDRGDRIMDFSAVGYQSGIFPLPNFATVAPASRVVTVNAASGDRRAAIQNAINQVAAFPLQSNGFRGIVQLGAGSFDISGGLSINTSGIILRGVGDNTDASRNTILRYTGTDGTTNMISVDSPNTRTTNTPHKIVDKVVPVGARSFTVDSTAGWAVGDKIVIQRPSPQNWINDIGMNQLDNPWTPGSKNQSYERTITYIDQARKRVHLGAPLPNAIEAKYKDTAGNAGVASKYVFNRTNNVGIENIRGDGQKVLTTPDSEAHAASFIVMQDTSNGWVRNVTGEHLIYATVEVGTNARNVTVDDAASVNPVSILTGGRRYPFNIEGSFTLMKNLRSDRGRHDFVNNSSSRGPNVFLDGVATNAAADSGPHQRWSTGTLFDNITTNTSLNLQNRLNSGSGHGWAGANMVIWNSTAGQFYVQSPPTAQNWIIGSTGSVRSNSQFGAPSAPGYYDANNVGSKVTLGGETSLYRKQLAERMANPNAQLREYSVGDYDGYENLATDGDNVFVDPAWRTQVASIENESIGGFDRRTQADRSVPFTFAFDAPTSGQSIIAATLTMAVSAIGSGASNDRIWLETAGNSIGFAELGTLPHFGNSDIVTLEFLASGGDTSLSFLQDGKLNVLVNDDHAVDWANLQLTFAPNTGSLLAEMNMMAVAVPEPALVGIASCLVLPLVSRARRRHR